MRYADWVRWLQSSGEQSPLLRVLARTLLGNEKDRVDAGGLYQSVRRVQLPDGSLITVGFLNGQPYAHIESASELANVHGSTCEIYMQSGLVDAAGDATLHPPTDATCATIVSSLTTDAYLSITTDGSGHATLTGRCEHSTDFQGFAPVTVGGITYTEAVKRTAQQRVPASVFSGLLGVYVQALYGSKHGAYRLAASGNALEVPLGDGTHLRLRWSRGQLASDEANGLVKIGGDYYFVGYGPGDTAYYRRLTVQECYAPLRFLLKAYVPVTDADKAAFDRFEAFYLSAGRPTVDVTTLTVSGATIPVLTDDDNETATIETKYGTTYGAQYSRRAAEACYVYHGRRITTTFTADSITAVENENVTDFMTLFKTPFAARIVNVIGDGSTLVPFDTDPNHTYLTVDEATLPTSVDAPVWAYYDSAGTQKVLRYSCELAVSPDSTAFTALDLDCVTSTFYSAPGQAVVNICGDVQYADSLSRGADVMLGYDYCEQTPRIRVGPLSRVVNYSAGFYLDGNSTVVGRMPLHIHRAPDANGNCLRELSVTRAGYPAAFAEVANFPTVLSYGGGSHAANDFDGVAAASIDNSSETAGSCGYCGTTPVNQPEESALTSCTVTVTALDYFSGYPDVYTVYELINTSGVIDSYCFFPFGASSAFAIGDINADVCYYRGGKIAPPSFLQPAWPHTAPTSTSSDLPIFDTPIPDYVPLRFKYHIDCTRVSDGTPVSLVTNTTTGVAPTAYGGFIYAGASNATADVTLSLGIAGTAVGSGHATFGDVTPSTISSAIPPSLGFAYTDYVAGTVSADYHVQDHLLTENVEDILLTAPLFDTPVLGKPYLVQSLRGDTITLDDYLRPGSAAYSTSSTYPLLTAPSFVGWA